MKGLARSMGPEESSIDGDSLLQWALFARGLSHWREDSSADEAIFSPKSSSERCWRDHALNQRNPLFDDQFALFKAT